MKISVYQTFNGYRVVAGSHLKATAHAEIQPRVYESAGDAYRIETDDKIRASILRIDPTATDDSTPVTQHHVVSVDRLMRAKKLIESAKRQLGDDLGGHSIRDLLADNMPRLLSHEIDALAAQFKTQPINAHRTKRAK